MTDQPLEIHELLSASEDILLGTLGSKNLYSYEQRVICECLKSFLIDLAEGRQRVNNIDSPFAYPH